ncbi:hypothetical protein [Flammeovirga aprica]|uniref:Uncharacterized protein n=1 Tax=Flammeovirga aprica JL-4 TaxID=694437 RepID=A0A7X9RYJ5_9BACT|nr:hypothetical protein [Flammeovirga aprica]NME71078.1 hypothetical protein [Flammeovirga aprica JL-4]
MKTLRDIAYLIHIVAGILAVISIFFSIEGGYDVAGATFFGSALLIFPLFYKYLTRWTKLYFGTITFIIVGNIFVWLFLSMFIMH